MPRGESKRGRARRERAGTPYDEHFSERSRVRGTTYFADGSVHGLTRDRQRYRARVIGTNVYAVELILPEPGRSMDGFRHDCDCPARARYGECKHEYATLLAVLATARDDGGESRAGAATSPGSSSLEDDGWSGAPTDHASSATSPVSEHARHRLRELHSLLDFEARSNADDDVFGSSLELGMRLELPDGFDLERLQLRPLVMEQDASSLDARRRRGNGARPGSAPIGSDAPAWRPFEEDDDARLSDVSTLALDLLERTVITTPVWGRPRHWSLGAADVLLIDDDMVSALVSPFVERERLFAPQPDGSEGSAVLVVEREPFVFGLRQIVDGRGRRLEAVLARAGVERVPQLSAAGDRVLLRVLEPALESALDRVTDSSNDAASVSSPGAPLDADVARPDAAVPVVLASFGWALVDGHRLVPIATDGATEVWKQLVLKGGIELDESPEVREALVEFAETAGTRLAGVDLPPITSCAPHPILRVDGPRSWWPKGKLPCEVALAYGGREVRPNDIGTRVLVSEAARYERDLAAEADRLDEAFANGLKPLPDALLDEDEDGWVAPSKLDQLVQRLIDLGWTVEAEGQLARTHTKSAARVASGTDWFGVTGTVRFDGVEVPLPDVLRAARKGATWIELGDGSRGLLPKDWLKRWEWLELGRENADGTLHFRREQGWLIDALLAARGPVDADAGFERFIERLERFERIEPKAPPASFQGELRTYQREGLGWFAHLERLGIGGCLADDMGLGKTVQVLAWLEARRKRQPPKGEERRPSLVIVPRSLLFNWKDEAARFTPKMRVALHHGPKRKPAIDRTFAADLVITTYGTLRSDIALFEDQAFDALVLDEAQAIKNERSLASKAVRLLEARQRVALSGTPIENGIDELWALFEFLNPGMLGTVPAFKRLLTGRSFDGPDGEDGSSGERAGGDAESDDDANGDPSAADLEAARLARVRAIGRAIRPFFLRRTKTQVLTDLPEKTEQIVQVELPPKQRKAYDETAAFYRAQLLGAEATDGGEPLDTMTVLTALLRLRQLACHPGLVDPERALEPSGKLDELIPMLTELVSEGHKAVVFSQFTSLLDLVAQRLDHAELGFETLTGKTRDRKRCVERFQTDPAVPLFLVSLKAGGTGLNLTAADYVFLLDPWWNPAAEAQAIDRAHRIGRTRPVHAYRLVARDTIEARVLELQEQKRQLAASLMDGAASSAGEITREDLRALLGG